jgi:hypothetical protein
LVTLVLLLIVVWPTGAHGPGSSTDDAATPVRARRRKHEHLRVYASPEVLAAADDAYNACWQWGNDATHRDDDEKFYD